MPWPHLLVHILLTIALFGGGFLLSRDRRGRWIALAGGASVAALGFFLSGHPEWTVRLFPFSDILFYMDSYHFAAALALAPVIGLSKSKAQKIRVALWMTLLFAVSAWPLTYYWKEPARVGAAWIDEEGICRQTGPDTCSAASCVTLLRQYGIESTEEEAARLAFTRAAVGTRALGQYRALRRIVARNGAPFRVRIRRMDYQQLVEENRPCIVTAGLKHEPRTDYERRFTDEWNWTVGVMHDVVFLGVDPKEPNKVFMADPDFGRERWEIDGLATLFQNYALILESTVIP